MVRSLDQISKELSKLETATTQIDEDLKALYKEYLTVLGKAVKQQLVLAVYHLCTQAYPDEFLALSVSQRERVQAGVRKIATQGQTQIEQLGQVLDLSSLANKLEEVVGPEVDAPDDEFVEVSRAEDNPSDSAAADAPVVDDRTVEHKTASLEAPLKDDEAGLAEVSREASEMIRRLSTSLSLFSVFGTEPLSPVSLAKRHVLLERHLRAILQTLSSLTNYLLKQANILPDLPEMVIAAAAEAEAGESGPSTPNVLNVLVEIGGDRQDDEEAEDGEDDADLDDSLFDEKKTDREMTHLVAVNLRLADIEFADAHTALWRSKLQEALLRLKRLGGRYQKLQREKAQAEAEHAWRAIWFES